MRAAAILLSPTPPSQDGGQEMAVNSKQPGSLEHRMNEKSTAANFSIQLTPAEKRRRRRQELEKVKRKKGGGPHG